MVALFIKAQNSIRVSVTINEQVYGVEIADTQQERELGLSGRETLDSAKGMLFVFPKRDFHTFWMRDMNFSLDIVWIDSDHTIVDIEREVSPIDYPQIYVPHFPAQYVLEVNAGEMLRIGAQIGQEVSISGI